MVGRGGGDIFTAAAEAPAAGFIISAARSGRAKTNRGGRRKITIKP